MGGGSEGIFGGILKVSSLVRQKETHLCLFLFARNSSNHGSHIAVETLELSERLFRLLFSEKNDVCDLLESFR